MNGQTMLWGIGWAVMGFTGISLVHTQMAADPRVKLGVELTIGALTLVGLAKIWGLLP